MKKSYLMLAAAAALFAACSNDDGVAEAQNAEQQVAAGEVPVGFDVYVNRGTTRAGVPGDVTTDALKTTEGAMRTAGFGVFAFYTNSDTYDPIFQPNFMYNEQVYSNGTAFSYSPVKYWPNEYSSANAEENDKVSFFAYAPWVDVTAGTGKVATDKDWGIVGMSRNTAVGDPLVFYNSTFDLAKQVDLVWGVAASASWGNKVGTAQGTAGMPWKDLYHPSSLNQKLTFTFKHALARLNVTVDLAADVATTTPTNVTEPAKTKIYIRSVTFSGFSTKGALNLNNTVANTPLWLSTDGVSDIESGVETTIYDGRKDGKEGLFAASSEKANINPDLVQSKLWNAAEPTAGVTETPVNLFAKSSGAIADTDPIYVIPNNDRLTITVVYDVLTADDNLPGYVNDGDQHGSVVTNTITKVIQDGSSNDIILAGLKKYTIALHIGLKSVQFDAAVTDYDPVTGSADLPTNP